MDIYVYTGSDKIDQVVIRLRRMGYTAYTEQDGDTTLLITNYQLYSLGFVWAGSRE